MNTAVGIMQTEQVGRIKKTFVGKSYSITAGDEFKITVGKSSLVMNADGSIIITGSSIITQAEGENKVIGKDVLINPPGASAGSIPDDYDYEEGSVIPGTNTTVGDPDQGGGGLDDLTRPIRSETLDKEKAKEARRKAEYRAATAKMGGLGRNNVDIVGYEPEINYDKEKYASMARAYGENSETGQFAVDALKKNSDLNDYNAQKAQIERNRANNIAAQAARARSNATQNNAVSQRPLDIKSGQPPSLYDDIGYENPMANVRDGWKGEAADGIKQSIGAGIDAAAQVNKGVAVGKTVFDLATDKDFQELGEMGVNAAQDKAKSKAQEVATDAFTNRFPIIDKANNAYEDYQTGQDLKDRFDQVNEELKKK
ncbi:hypothetical protein AADH33_04960 [Psychrobacter sp. KFRI-CH2-11]|uniref:hypothetical protein n=1 Tax=Psychrobacter sp. KFRI-CH2-11 TaxID=3156079 RepID=UPI0032549146